MFFSTAGTTSTAATAALCSVLATVIIAEGVIVLGLAVALYRAKRTAKSPNLYSLALNNTYNTCGGESEGGTIPIPITPTNTTDTILSVHTRQSN